MTRQLSNAAISELGLCFSVFFFYRCRLHDSANKLDVGIIRGQAVCEDSCVEAHRAAGWVGSNVLLWMLPLDARLSIVRESEVVPQEIVRGSWKKLMFMRTMEVSSRGWLTDMLPAVRKIGKGEFSLVEVYVYERELARLHRDNRHVKDKIRQQLQLLRDKGIIDFAGKGKYSIRP